MYVIRWFLLKSCIFGVFISVTEASVLLQTFDGEMTYIKGSNVTLVCTITPYNNVMTWYVDNQLYADCFLGNCGPSLNKPYTFNFTFDETAGVFKLNIDSMDSSHAALSFACDDGNVRETISFNLTTVANEGNGDNDDRTLDGGAIAGIVVGIVVVIVFSIAVIIVVYLNRWKNMFGKPFKYTYKYEDVDTCDKQLDQEDCYINEPDSQKEIHFVDDNSNEDDNREDNDSEIPL
ncbi:uncharacterized protein LOC132755851, partial [Ruditapes philippinarum]|uniref:uncharacterized protein LOC132755851 n=1 Tax=Ruditapes philippinarum TaxID=129788 RepID=UPI00295B6848